MMKSDRARAFSTIGTATIRVLTGAILGSLLLTPVSAAAQRRSSPDYAEQQAADQAARMIAEREAAAKAAAPWHFDTEPYYRFNRGGSGGILASEKHFRSAFDWVFISNYMTNRRGMFPDYTLYIGVMPDGQQGGAIYGDSTSAIIGEVAATKQLMKITKFTVFAEDGEVVEIELSPVKTAEYSLRDDPKLKQKIYYRQFELPPRAYRMMAALPEKNRMRFLYADDAGAQGNFSYYNILGEPHAWAYSIGYAKELSQLARKPVSK